MSQPHCNKKSASNPSSDSPIHIRGKFGQTKIGHGEKIAKTYASITPTNNETKPEKTSQDDAAPTEEDIIYANWCSQRREKLIQCLQTNHGIDSFDLISNTQTYGISAQRMFRKFCYPKIRLYEVLSREDVDKAAIRTASNIHNLIQSHGNQTKKRKQKEQEVQRNSENDGTATALVLILDNLRSAYNVGAILRIAETSSCDKVYSCGITPYPPHAKLERTACGAENLVPMEYYTETLKCVNHLKANGYYILALEEGVENTKTTPYCFMDVPSMISNHRGIALVIGAEMIGVDAQVLQLCHEFMEIPMLGLKRSMNVSTATSVVVFEIVRQLGKFERFRHKIHKK